MTVAFVVRLTVDGQLVLDGGTLFFLYINSSSLFETLTWTIRRWFLYLATG